MKIIKPLTIFIIGFLPVIGIAQNSYQIETTDITNFWNAYDLLEGVDTLEPIARNFLRKLKN